MIIVDNGSQVPYILPTYLQPDSNSGDLVFEVVRSESNLGFTGGNNLGIHYSIEKYNSEFVFLLNSDTTVDPNVLKELISFADEHPRMGIISPKIYFSKGSEFHSDYEKQNLGKIIWYAGGTIDWQHLVAFHRCVDEIDRGQARNVSESDFATGCAMLIRREVLEKVGTFDKRYFLYLEDVDLCVRARNLGYEIGFCNSAVVWHKNAGSGDGVGNVIQSYYQTRNRMLFAFKHGTAVSKINAVRIGLSKIFNGSAHEKLGILHAITAQFGKQQIV